MSIQTTVGSSALIGIGIGAGDVATLVNVGYRIGNWWTAPKSDVDLLALLEEPETAIVRRRGIMDSPRFNRRWDVRVRLLENGRAQRQEGQAVERLLQAHSQWTALMICIVAALDEFADASTVRLIIKTLLRSLFCADENMELNEDLVNSSLSERINGWRSAGTVREMNNTCRSIRQDLIRKALVMQGFIPKAEALEISSFLYWLLTEDTEDYHTSSSDLAGIACCLCYLSFETLSVEGFDPVYSRETPCRLIYNDGLGHGRSDADRSHLKSLGGTRWKSDRSPSTIVSLTQPEETFSTFPISPATANKCRTAWGLGTQAAHPVRVGIKSDLYPRFFGEAANFKFSFINEGTSVTVQERTEPVIFSLAKGLFIFCTNEVIQGLKEVLGDEPPECSQNIWDDITRSGQHISSSAETRETFHVLQAFLMGYWYKVLGNLVDTSDLEVRTVSGCWGYLSVDLCKDLRQVVTTLNIRPAGFSKNEAFISPEKVLRLVGLLWANIDAKIPEDIAVASHHHQGICVGLIGKRAVLCRSLLRNSRTSYEVAKYILLDCDVGGVPRNQDGLVTTSTNPRFSQEDGSVMASHMLKEGLCLRGSEEDCTRHIQVDWDGDSGAVLLCIRYRGRRIATLNPAFADRLYVNRWKAPPPEPGFRNTLTSPAWEVTLESLLDAGRLLMPPPSAGNSTNVVILVQSQGNDCFRYAAAALYAEFCEIVLVSGDVQRALEECARTRGGREGDKKMIALIA